MRNPIANVALGAVFLLHTCSAFAQSFPERTVRLIVNVSAGGITDTLARIVGQGLSEQWGKPVIVENRAGANSVIAAQAVTREVPDGHTLLVTADNTFTGNPSLVKNLGYSYSEFTPIAIICRTVPVLAVSSSVPVKSMQEFIELARSKPGVFNFGSTGVGSYSHLGMEDLAARTGIKLVHMPYRGAAPAMEALMRGEVASVILNYSTAEAFEGSGNLRILAMAQDRRYQLRPELPTIAETVLPQFNVSAWFGIFGPAKLSDDTRQKLITAVTATLDTPKAKDYFRTNSCERMDLAPDQISKLVSDDAQHWDGIVKASSISVQ